MVTKPPKISKMPLKLIVGPLKLISNPELILRPRLGLKILPGRAGDFKHWIQPANHAKIKLPSSPPLLPKAPGPTGTSFYSLSSQKVWQTEGQNLKSTQNHEPSLTRNSLRDILTCNLLLLLSSKLKPNKKFLQKLYFPSAKNISAIFNQPFRSIFRNSKTRKKRALPTKG